MNYYNEIKEELINHEMYKITKDYSKNKNEKVLFISKERCRNAAPIKQMKI